MKRMNVDENGAVGGVEGLAFAVVIFVFGTLVIANAWGVIDAKLATSAAAREAARSYVEGTSQEASLRSAEAAALSALAGHNRRASSIRIEAASANDTYRRCQPIVAVVETEVPRVPLPLMQRSGGTYTVVSRHQEVVDPYKAGLDDPARCER